MEPIDKVRTCLVLNVLLMGVTAGSILAFASDTPYFRFGPNDTFVVISVRIHTTGRYVCLLCLIAFLNSVKVLVAELGEPVLVFTVYNPDKQRITEFSKHQLLFYANAMFLLSNVRRVFEVMVTVTQFDIALFSVLVEQLVSCVTVSMLVHEKDFDLITPYEKR
jgi:hypothetical protein